MSDSSETHHAEPDTHYRRTGLWEQLTTTRVNPLNLKCETLPVFSLKSQYARNFHLSWFAFWVAFLSWFAFAPLIPEAVKDDLKLTPAQIGNSNICALCATLIVRLIVGPLVDRFGPRKVMAALLAIGAIPSGLAGLVTSVSGLYAVRFFIGILGGTFVPCQAWTTTFFDKKIVGTANALVGGWGNSGGGFTFIIMVALYERLLRDGLSPHSAWRAAFAIVPVPVLLGTSVLVMVFGTDHPAGRWSERYNIPAARTSPQADPEKSPRDRDIAEEKKDVAGIDVTVSPASPQEVQVPLSAVDTAVNQALTAKIAAQILANPLTWLPSAAYATTFGYELAIDAYLANVLFGLYKSDSFGQTKSGYVASVFGMLNIFTRPMGGYLGDMVYRRFGVAGKKYLTLLCGFLQGVFSLGLGLYLERGSHPSLDVVVVFIVIIAVFNEGKYEDKRDFIVHSSCDIALAAGNGANFALVPHCNPNYNGFMSGLVGAAGNVGGIIFAVIFRFQPAPVGHAFWISGIIAMGVNVLLMTIRVPKW